jgi:hypothetical protein
VYSKRIKKLTLNLVLISTIKEIKESVKLMAIMELESRKFVSFIFFGINYKLTIVL